MNLVQIADGFCQKGDTHGAKTSACATGHRRSFGVFHNPIQTHVHRVEGEETAVFFVVVEAFVVGDVHLHRWQSNQQCRLNRGGWSYEAATFKDASIRLQVVVVAVDLGVHSISNSANGITCKETYGNEAWHVLQFQVKRIQ